jgi:probable F420-dependent oxidoreductase
MKLGIQLPQTGTQGSAENLIRVARLAEDLGYDSLWTFERTLWPINPQNPYPGSPDGKLPEIIQVVFDPLETLTFVAAQTERVRLGTSVLVLGYHNPLQLARRISTLDHLSGGRVDLGVGIGWSRDEYMAAGTPFAKRGARGDEFLQVMIDLWTKDPVGFDGEFYHIPESRIGPKPVQKPYPPIYVGGSGANTFERAARFGAGWNPSGVSSLEELEKSIKEFRETSSRLGSANKDVVLRVFIVVLDSSTGGSRSPLIGTIDQLRDDFQRLSDIGVTELLLTLPEVGFIPATDIESGLRRMEQLIEISK